MPYLSFRMVSTNSYVVLLYGVCPFYSIVYNVVCRLPIVPYSVSLKCPMASANTSCGVGLLYYMVWSYRAVVPYDYSAIQCLPMVPNGVGLEYGTTGKHHSLPQHYRPTPYSTIVRQHMEL